MELKIQESMNFEISLEGFGKKSINNNEAAQAFVICDSAGNSVIGDAEELEV